MLMCPPTWGTGEAGGGKGVWIGQVWRSTSSAAQGMVQNLRLGDDESNW